MTTMETLSGNLPDIPLGEGPAPGYPDPETGMRSDYWILSEEERQKGFVRPVRRSYIHEVCGYMTSMAQEIAETFASSPGFYTKTYRCKCKTHLPVSQFYWAGTKGLEVLGS